MKIFTVSFFGHRSVPFSPILENNIRNIIIKLISEKEYVDFLVSRGGDFDYLVTTQIRKVKQTTFDANSSLIWVQPYHLSEYQQNKAAFDNYYDLVEICEESALAYPKRAIQIRNRKIIERSDLVVCYVTENSGGAYNALMYAKKINKPILNLAKL